jgi:tetratricopeptide (TPR) repeat protein
VSRRSYTIIMMLMVLVAVAVRLNNAALFPGLLGYDGFAHFTYIWFLADTGRVPLATAGWEFFQPPLYYVFMASIWKVFAGLDPILRLQIGTGVVSLLGITPALVTAVIVNDYFPGKRLVQCLAFGLMLFLPMHFYSSAFIGNEALNAVLCSWCLLALWLTLKEQTWRRTLILGLCLGLAMLVKFTAVVVVAAAFATIGIRSLINKDYLGGVKTLGLLAAVVLIVCGWFYVRNVSVYGTPFQMSRTELFLQNAENSQPQGQRGILEYVLFDPMILYDPHWPRGLSLNRARPLEAEYSPLKESVLTGLYANAWFDGFGGFALPAVTHNEVSRRAGQIMLTLAVVPTAVILFGFWTACGRLRRDGWDDTIVFMMIAFVAMWAVFLFGTRTVPTHAAIKATYFMPVSVVFSFWFAMGLNRIALMDRAYLTRVTIACALLAAISCVVFAHGLVVGQRWVERMRSGADVQNLYGVVHYAADQRSQAKEWFERSAYLGSFLAQENLAALALEDGELTEALYRSRRALRLNASSARIANASNGRHFRMGRVEQLNSIAVIYAKLGLTDDAIAIERGLVRMKSRIPEVRYNLGVLKLLQALEVSDDDRQSRSLLIDQANRLFRETLVLDPGFHQALSMIGVSHAMRGNCETATEFMRKDLSVMAASYRLYPIETGPGDINAAALSRRRQIEPVPPRLEPATALAGCNGHEL